MNTYKSKLRANKAKYIPAAGPYKTTNNVKVPFNMPEFSISIIITQFLHVDNTWGDEGISYEMIIDHD